MPLYDRRTMEGVYSVDESAHGCAHYRYAEEHMMRIMAGWIALTQNWVKLELDARCGAGYNIQVSLSKRLPELRSRARVSGPPSEAFVTFVNTLANREEPADTIGRLVGIFRPPAASPERVSPASLRL